MMMIISSAAGSPHSRQRRFVVKKLAGGVGTPSGKKGAGATLPPLVLVGMVDQPVPTSVAVPSQAPQQQPYYPPQQPAYPAPQAAAPYYAPPQPAAPYIPQMANPYYAPAQPSPYAPQMGPYVPQMAPYYAPPAYSAQQVGAGQPSAAAGLQQKGQWQSAGSDFAGSSTHQQQPQQDQLAAGLDGNQQQLPLDNAVTNDDSINSNSLA